MYNCYNVNKFLIKLQKSIISNNNVLMSHLIDNDKQ